MAANGVVFRQSAGYSASFRSEFENLESRSFVRSVGMKQKKSSRGVLSCVFRDQGHLQYYKRCSGKSVCGKRENPEKKASKMMKKKMKLMKDLRRDLLAFSEMRLVSDEIDGGLLNQVNSNGISEAAGLLLEQIQKIKSEEKELKRMIKEGKSRTNNLIDCNTSSSSSSSSSESSDSDCGEVVNMNSLEQQQQQHPLAEQILVPVQTISPAAPSLPPSNVDNDPSSSTSPASVNFVDTVDATAKKIEVCVGLKCKKSGSTSLIDEFQRVLGAEGSVSGCKCMGKCKSGPVVKVSTAIREVEEDDDDDSVVVRVLPSSNSLWVGVGLEDVSSIVANLLLN